MEIKNRETVIEKLAEMLKQFDIDMNKDYQTDVYMYVDSDGNAKLDLFANVGGNSWRDDDHYTICSDGQHYESFMDVFQTIEEIANVLEIKHDELIKAVAEEETMDIEDVSWYEVSDYAFKKYTDKMFQAYVDSLDNTDYTGIAEEIFSEWERQQEMFESLSED